MKSCWNKYFTVSPSLQLIFVLIFVKTAKEIATFLQLKLDINNHQTDGNEK